MPKSNPVRYFVLSNGKTTSVYEWDKDEPILSLDFSDFTWGNPKLEHLKAIIGADNVAKPTPTAPRKNQELSPLCALLRSGAAAICFMSQGYLEI